MTLVLNETNFIIRNTSLQLHASHSTKYENYASVDKTWQVHTSLYIFSRTM